MESQVDLPEVDEDRGSVTERAPDLEKSFTAKEHQRGRLT